MLKFSILIILFLTSCSNIKFCESYNSKNIEKQKQGESNNEYLHRLGQ